MRGLTCHIGATRQAHLPRATQMGEPREPDETAGLVLGALMMAFGARLMHQAGRAGADAGALCLAPPRANAVFRVGGCSATMPRLS